MDEKLRRYIEGLFNDVPQTKNTIELKEEMIQNLKEKYDDLISEGKTEEAAYNIAVASIGDISSLLYDLNMGGKGMEEKQIMEGKQKSAALTAIAVMLYILSIIPIIVTPFRGIHNSGLIGFLIMITVATGILIYNGMTKQKYHRSDDTMVEEFKEWKTQKGNRRSLRLSISLALWSIIIAAYFVISFTTFAWEITWVIFVFGIAIEALLNIFFIMKK